MEGLVLRSLAKIRKLVGVSSRKHKALRDACDTVIGACRVCVCACVHGMMVEESPSLATLRWAMTIVDVTQLGNRT